MSEHTPGPWKIEKHETDQVDRDWTIEHHEANNWGNIVVCAMRDCRDMEANASLIAAAPRLLAENNELRAWAKLVLSWTQHPDRTIFDRNAVEQACLHMLAGTGL